MASTLPSANDCCTPCAHATPTVVVVTPGGDSSSTSQVFDTLEDLRAYESALAELARYAIVLGETVPGDGNGRHYWFDVDGSDADNGASVIRPDDFIGTGVWRQYI